MPVSIGIAIASSVVGSAVAGMFSTAIVGAIFGGLASAVVSGVLNRVVNGGGGDDRGTPAITQEGRMLTVRQAAAPWQIIYGERKVGGTFTFIEVSADNQYLHLVITYSGHVCNQIGDIYFEDEVVPLDGSGEATGTYAGYVRIKKSLGDEGDVQPFPDLVSESAGKWTSAHKQRGRTKIYVRLKANPDLFPGGTPNITAVIQGKKVYDPRSTLTVYSANAALCVNDYLTDTTFGIGATYATEVDETALIAAANLCDEDVSLDAGGTEDRYRVGGAFDVSVQPREAMGRMLGAMAGHAVNVGGKWFIYGGAYEAPTVTLDEGDLAGAIRVQSLVSRRENANGVKGVFTDPNSHWQVTDFPALGSATYMAEDGGQRVWKDVDFSAFVTSGTQAQRLSKIELLRLRQGLAAVGQFKLTAYQAVTGRTVALSNTKFGWSSKAFKVDSARFTVNDDGTLGVELGLRETAAAVYDWSTSEEQEIDIAPNTNLPDPLTVAAPGIVSIVEALYETTGSAGVKAKATVTWSAPAPDADYQLEHRKVGTPDWTVDTRVRGSQGTVAEVLDLESGTSYDFRVKAINLFGVSSDYFTQRKEIVGLTADPSDLTGFSLTPLGNQADLSWDKSADLDVRIGGRIMVRWSPKTTGAIWNDGVEVANVPGDVNTARVVHLTGTYMARAQDSSGNQSANAVSVVTTTPDITGFNAVASLTEDPAFSGTKTGTIVIASRLTLDSGELIDDMLDPIDTWGFVDTADGVRASGTYDFSTYIDLGAVYTSRVTATLKTLSVDTGDFIDARLDPIDSWGLVDGPEISDVNAELFVATTNDDPAGAPTWSSWRPFLIGDYKARAFKFQLVLTSENLNHNIQVINLGVAVDMPDREDGARNVASGAGTKTVSYTLSPVFKALPKIGITAKNMGTGDYFTITSEGLSSFDVTFRNSAAAAVDRNFDWRAKGY